MTSATARAKTKAPKAEKQAIALVDKQGKKVSPHEFYANQPPMTEHCIELTQAALMASGEEYRELTKNERRLIEEAAELKLVPSATIMLANVLCSDSGKGARQTLSELIHAQVSNPEAKAAQQARTVSEKETIAFNSLIALMTDMQKKHGLIEALQVAIGAINFTDEEAVKLSKQGMSDMEKQRAATAVSLVHFIKDMRREIAKSEVTQ